MRNNVFAEDTIFGKSSLELKQKQLANASLLKRTSLKVSCLSGYISFGMIHTSMEDTKI